MNLGLNFHEHPTRKRLYVFHFKVEDHSTYFKELLSKKGIPFEYETNVENGIKCHFYGIKSEHFKRVQIMNYMVSARYRKPFIPDPALRYFVVFFVIGVILLAIVGALYS
jgi:hypothetical protein